ncbi:MAG TPA: methyltransferase domain-containing protein [Tepidisphaeraceae bacterium]|jgi:SAM-dependent methyltransferase
MSQPPPSSSEPRIVDYENRDYRQYWQGADKQLEHQHETKVLRELLPTASGWFLDLGCAHGRLLPLYDRTDRQIVMLDYSMVHIDMAAEKFAAPNHFFIAADAYRLPFKADIFNGLLSVRVFHHMEKPDKAMDEVARVLAPGGHAVIEYSNKRNLLRVLRYGAASFKQDHISYDGDMLFGTHPSYFAELAQRAHLVVRRSRGIGTYDQLVRHAPLLKKPGRVLEPVLDRTLGAMNLAPSIFADVEKTGGQPAGAGTMLADILACPACKSNLRDEQMQLACTSCGKSFPVRGRIYDFRIT